MLEIREEGSALLDEIADRAGDFRPALAQAGQIMEEGLDRQWASRGGYFNAPWPALAASTLKRKAREGLSPAVLEATGSLRAAVTGGRGHVHRVARTRVRVGTKDFRAQFHQHGAPGANLPARKLVGLAPADRERILRLILRHLIK